MEEKEVANKLQGNSPYVQVATFEDGFAQNTELSKYKEIKELKVKFNSNSKYWVLLSEIKIVPDR